MKNYITYIFIKSLSRLITFLPRIVSIKLAKILGLIINTIFPKRKKVARKNLGIAFPDKSTQKINAIIKRTYQHYMIVMFEFLRQKYLNINRIKLHMDDNTKEILSSNNGLILMTAHLGNWEMIVPLLNKYKKSTIVVKKQRNSGGDKFLYEARGFKNISLLPMGSSKRAMIDALLRGEVLGLASDQNAGNKGIKVPFFGHEVSIPKGAAYFHYKTKCPIVFGFCILKEDYSYDFKLRVLDTKQDFNDAKDLFFAIHSKYSALLEHEIKKNPELYFWFHKKWDRTIYH